MRQEIAYWRHCTEDAYSEIWDAEKVLGAVKREVKELSKRVERRAEHRRAPYQRAKRGGRTGSHKLVAVMTPQGQAEGTPKVDRELSDYVSDN